MTTIEVTLPDDLQLKGLAQEHNGMWRAALGPWRSGYLQARVGNTPQQAVDLATAAVRRHQQAPQGEVFYPDRNFNITLDL